MQPLGKLSLWRGCSQSCCSPRPGSAPLLEVHVCAQGAQMLLASPCLPRGCLEGPRGASRGLHCLWCSRHGWTPL